MLKSIDSFTVDISVIYTEDTTRSRLLFSEMIVSEFSEPISLSAVLIVSECAVGEKKQQHKGFQVFTSLPQEEYTWDMGWRKVDPLTQLINEW